MLKYFAMETCILFARTRINEYKKVLVGIRDQSNVLLTDDF